MLHIDTIEVGGFYFFLAHGTIVRIRRIIKIPSLGVKNGKRSQHIRFEDYSFNLMSHDAKPTLARSGSCPREYMSRWLRRAEIYTKDTCPFFREVVPVTSPHIVPVKKDAKKSRELVAA